MISLIKIESGTQVRITSFEGDARMVKRLNQYGLFPGDIVIIRRVAPFNGPILLEVGGREIALGKSVAARVLVEIVTA